MYNLDFNLESLQKIAQECIEIMTNENSGKRILIHCFSNNGAVLYQQVSQLLKERPNK